MKALIVEDSRLARVELKDLLQAHPQIELVGEAENPRDAVLIIAKERPELLFLDINMPGKNGFELLEELDYDPKVIFITAYTEYALRAFEFSTIDYLVKPISAERLKIAVDKLSNAQTETPDQQAQRNLLDMTSSVLLREGENCHWVQLKDIDYFESSGNYTQVVWSKGQTLIYRALGKIEERLPEKNFFRASRQHIVNIDKIASVDVWINGGFKLKLTTGVEIEVSRRHTSRFKDFFSL
jgi:two-component system LytT family response regulator